MEVIKSRSFRRGRFKLSSGIESDLYFNLKSTMMDPKGAFLSASVFLPIIRDLSVDFVGGLEMGAVPVLGSIAALSSGEANPVKTFFVRKQAKTHGTKELVEGLSQTESLAGKRVLIVDDVASTGGSILSAISSARSAGAVVSQALVLIDREMGGREALRDEKVELISIFGESDFTDK